MNRSRRLAIIVVPLVILIGLFLPLPTTVVPEWTIRVVDQNGNPVAGSKVRQIWQHYTFEETGHEEVRVTDQNGIVTFPRRVIARPILIRITYTAWAFVTLIAHGSMGPDAYLIGIDNGGSVVTRSASELPDKMVVHVEDNQPVLQQSPTPELSETIFADIPKDSWEKIFFESINERTAKTNIKPLRNKTLPEGDVEVRIWRGFGLAALVGWSMRRDDGKWDANYFDTDFVSNKWVYKDRSIGPPKSGWDSTWNSLLQAGLLALPDSDTLNCDPMVQDGISYVVELKKGRSYRTYKYSNPDMVENECQPAKQMLKIIEILRVEFGEM